ncbi:2-dehydro-3-deoxygalactonokinase [Phaeobacter gallaeciensis]|uniref:2-keto-3-deoxy-galactonokinase n=1 Tax=Phaeobacter gallaeciensis TaxID=60890 RepID=A0AAC9ZA41_9RHOB|nr:2-dehydro-3-deoxygalactonokinase [Phaeobacter gallaeciensis]AHD10489.1 2-keto-3-deoxy-galactonokinase [Phaeobacter gallaeciensis DSM 26640]ATE93752.1 2-keto-3-deoxy-galactonokinase [Phaeobacter gallaeciensis]ATE96427.1 2-keto-3-deoxy-galactonokinase [Phaeobacter gallaeciensis]ATF02416.1 2-keto-3-deoxy-galactonokinase [Phaeobacter gallaeciensis]ATF06796.1 2-keto-3-deoxy-galactonokinase [Phaeobacter gallaeciensis]
MTAPADLLPDKTPVISAPAWIAVDWGTSQLRLWVMDARNKVIDRITSDRGMSRLGAQDYEPTLLGLLDGHLSSGDSSDADPIPVICCGMAGSRQGWAEAPYAAAPCPPPGISDATMPRTQDPRLEVYLLPGIKTADPADVMRGEETQIAGFLAQMNGLGEPQIICLPGTHSKWARLDRGQVTTFTTFMTGEMFTLLQGQSVLRHCVSGDGWDDAAFKQAVAETFAAPSGISAQLFRLRADALLSGQSPETARARLSGLLIGAELAAAQTYWSGKPVAVLGTDALARCYETALSTLGCVPQRVDGETLTLAGLSAAYDQLQKSRTP